MSSRSSSLNFLVGIVSLCAVWITFALWNPSRPDPAVDETGEEPAPEPRGSGFRYAPTRERERTTFPVEDTVYTEDQIRRQLQRRSMMERQEVRKNIVENESMPEAVRSRFRAELDRLDRIAEAHPEIARQESVGDVPRQMEDDGTFTDEFREVVRVMKQDGVWDRIHDEYVRNLEEAANDPSLPPEDRPTREQIERIRSGGIIPTL